jgi:hypothetical protein
MKEFKWAFEGDEAYVISILARHKLASGSTLSKLVAEPRKWTYVEDVENGGKEDE